MISMSSFPTVSSFDRTMTVQQMRRKMVAFQIRAMLRREAYVRYAMNLGGVGLLILTAVALIQLAALLGHPLILSGRDIGIVRMVSVAVAAIATLVTAILWWRSHQDIVRRDLIAIQLRLDLDESE